MIQNIIFNVLENILYCSSYIKDTEKVKIFTAVYSKHTTAFEDKVLVDNIQMLLLDANKRFFPVRNFDQEITTNNQGNNSSCVWMSCTNEPSGRTFQQVNEKIHFLDVIGTINLSNQDLVVENYFNLQKTTSASGRFSLVKIDLNSIEFVTDMVGTCPIFYIEIHNYFIVSTSSRIVHFIEQSLNNPFRKFSPSYNIESLRDFSIQGHFNHSGSAFNNIKCLQLNSRLRIDVNGIYINNFNQNIYERGVSKGKHYEDLIEDLASSIKKACLPLLELSSITFPISGGRDSRLVAAAMYAIGLRDVRCATSGYEKHPDVILGKEIATTLGWDHKINTPGATPNILSYEDPLSRVSRVLDVHDLQTSAWDDIEDYGPFINNPVLSGVGGELLRGGYMATKNSLINSSQATKMIKSFLNGNIFFESSLESGRLSNSYCKFLIEMANIDPMLALDYLYYSNRNFRWVGARRRGLGFRRIGVEPLLDNRVVALSRKIDINTKWEERLFFDVISFLNPDLRDIPIEGSRWRFETDNPFRNYESGWDRRVALKAETKSRNFDFRSLFNVEFRKEIYSMILDSNSELNKIGINRGRLEKYLGDEQPKYPTIIWHLLTTINILNNSWIKPMRNIKNLSREMNVPI